MTATVRRSHPRTALRRPPLLAPGARVALVSPAGPLRGPADLERAIANVQSLGWEPIVAPNVLARRGYFAGSDDERAGDLRRALRDPEIDAVWCARGGYGAMRVLESLDYAALARRPKALLGFSDITALHAALATRSGIASYHAPTARGVLTAFSRDSLERAVVRGVDPCGAIQSPRVLRPGVAEGRLVGGNLALLVALLGTPYFPPLDGAILVLEDVGEAVYRLDRMLVQLRLAGALSRIAGLVFGAFTDCPETSDDGVRRLDEVLDEAAAAAGVPALANAPVGHIDEQWTLPLGLTATLDAGAGTLHVH
ncbi:MAG: LD-carboxypeptidase [Gemmatimonadaceae bacterium]|nr:LD-carboxypeptidase [Gemmatimonadaceae bacterium]NUQ94202.1 LD-carboxypeptidase [Gemmatimonadaceae bacterium]NUR21053.1 LD-carboxypeptidase [Gemmatimonadaceae bacterium]NUS99270.1 LD-carboxypeptidase [Gemmatimonadaceae bacterium]